MNIVLTILCRNEADIIADVINFHRNNGVDFIIATDNSSDDGTTDILLEYQKHGCLHLISEPEFTHDQAVWVTRMARMAAVEFNADWVINTDADEFWWPANGSLKETFAAIAADIDLLEVNRTNFVPILQEEGSYLDRMTIRETRSYNSFGAPLPPKVCHRAYADINVADGNHKVTRSDSLPMKKSTEHDLEILHFPLRTYQQFERKIHYGAEALMRNERVNTTGIGGTWRYLYDEYYLKGKLLDYYKSQCPPADEIAAGLREGRYVTDRRLKQFLAGIDT